MSEVTIKLEAGVCQFKTIVIANIDDEMNVTYRLKSECPSVRRMSKGLEPMPVFEIIAPPFTENVIYKACETLEHVTCPVPCAMLKAAEASAELALKKDVTIEFQ